VRCSFLAGVTHCWKVIFGVGLNQLSDFCEERVPESLSERKVIRNGIGSVAAGIVAGYFSHVPHNLSTMKLLQPGVSYSTHFSRLVDQAEAKVPKHLPSGARRTLSSVRALLWPTGVMIRSTQIIGSFVILNGVSHLLDVRQHST